MGGRQKFLSMKRRTFIKTGIVLGGVGLLTFLSVPSFQKTVKKILIKDTAQLKLDESVIDQFLTDASREQFWLRFSTAKRIMIIGYTYAGFMKSILPYHNKYVRYRGQITGRFMHSTDFFMNKMDTEKPVQYTQFFNPYKQPCNNPFAVIHYPETA